MKIALVHYRAGLMDGVSLEMEKWKKVLEDMGHDVKIVAGNSAKGVDIKVEELSFDHPMYEKIKKNFFSKLEDFSEKELEETVLTLKEEFYIKLRPVMELFDVIAVNNIWSLALAPHLGLALEQVASELDNRYIGHHHDFWWERNALVNPTTSWGKKILEKHFPPDLPNLRHVVINSFAKEKLLKTRGIRSIVVPNVFDFSYVRSSEKMKRILRDHYHIPKGAIVALQATRITQRKAIELSIKLVAKMKELGEDFVGRQLYDGRKYDGNIILAFSGMCERDAKDYENKIMGFAFDMGVMVLNLYRDVEKNIFSFWDMYSIADFITYPSILEGWGNQLLEALAAAKPIALFEYPVFEKDIKSSGIRYVSLGRSYKIENDFVTVNDEVINAAAREMLEILFDRDKYQSTIKENFEIGKKNFGYRKLKEILSELL